MPPAHLRSPTMASNASSSDPGSPGPNIHYEKVGYTQQPSYTYSDYSALPEVERLRHELEDARIRIDRDTNVINSLHEKVTQLDELVKKQQVTISNQSKTISDRRPLRKQQSHIHAQVQSPMAMGYYPMTPSHHHHVHHCQYPGSGASAAPCGGTVCVVQNTLSPFEGQTAQAQSQAQTPQSACSLEYASQSGTVFDQPPPKFEIPLGPYASSAQVSSSGLVAGLGRPSDVFSPFASTAAPNGLDYATPASSNGATDGHKKMADFSNRFQALMRMSEVFGQTHASLPNIFMDSHMDDHIKEYLMAISRGTKASDLLGNAATRGFFVAKAMNWYLVEKVLCITAISGFDASALTNFYQDTTMMRHIMLTAVATHIAGISKRPGFAEYNHQNIHAHLHKLWAYIGPLGHDAAANQNGSMWNDLHNIISEAQSLAIDMYSSPLEYRFEFPEQSEPFDPQTMINRDPWVLADPSALQNTDTRVRLGITPIARIRDNSQGPGDVQMVYMGHVLLKGPKKQML
ncbi:hypothetical protein BDW74DRAFT_143954 [Aspergillus multicolor]|uniref:uncharacterized protein n=1 Tax=Aspergillus multicolor TaxID=41759 RepID=UPI003CCD848C